MRSLLRFLALCAAVALCVCYDVFVPPNQANSFITPQRPNVYNVPRGNGLGYYRFTRRPKSPAEKRKEICEDYTLCRFYAYNHGYPQAYLRYFGSQIQPQRPAGPRRY
uniref:Matrix Gla protein n=1 Tax=Monopterus albus TaxID=43700 RepID=A0A3Q3IFT0_MONAL|nr:matrix Gla protein isoform X2 [Monopterus albus]